LQLEIQSSAELVTNLERKAQEAEKEVANLELIKKDN